MIRKLTKVDKDLPINEKRRLIYKELSGLNLEDIFISSIANEGIKIEGTKDLSNLAIMEKYIKENEFLDKDRLIKEIRSLQKKTIEDFLVYFNKVKGDKLLFDKNFELAILEKVYFSYQKHTKDILSFKEFMNKYLPIIRDIENNIPENKDIVIFFIEQTRKMLPRLNKEDLENLINTKKQDFIRTSKLALSDLHGIDAIIEENGVKKIVDLKSASNLNLTVEEFSDKRNKSIGWIENQLTQSLIIGDFSHTNNSDINKIKGLLKEIKTLRGELTEEELDKVIDKYNDVVENVDISNIHVERKEYEFEKIRKIKNGFNKLELLVLEEFNKGNFKIDNEFIRIYEQEKGREEVDLLKQENREQYNERKDLLNKAEKVIYYDNLVLGKKHKLMGCMVEGKYISLSSKEVDLTDSIIQSELQNHRQKNISQSFKVRNDLFDSDMLNKFLEKIDRTESISNEVKEVITKGGLRIKKKRGI